MSADRPKEFGGFNADALANMRSLEKLDMPFAQAITPGSQAFKRNGFHETYVGQDTTGVTDRFVLTGYDGFDATEGVAVFQGSSTTQRFRRARLRFAVRNDEPEHPAIFGGYTVVGPHGTLLLGTQYGANVAFGVSQSFGRQEVETIFYAPGAGAGEVYTPPSVSRVVRGPVGGASVETHNPCTFAQYVPGSGTGRVVSGAGRRLDNGPAASAGYRWASASLPAMPGPYNYATSPIIVLRPDTFVFVSSPVVGGFGVSAAPGEFPAVGTSIPLPQFLFSTNGGLSYDPIDLTYMLAGGSNAWKLPVSAVDISAVGRDFHMEFLSNGFFVSLLSPINTGVSTYALEPRVFVGQNLLALTQVNAPPGYGVVWEYMGRMIIDPSHSRIAFCLTNINSAGYDQFSKSSDEGFTWTVEPLPWPSERCGFPVQTKDGVLEILVSEGPDGLTDTVQDIALWRSNDFGTTWKRIATVLENIRRTVATRYTGSFLFMNIYLTLGGFPRAGVNTYQFDSRVKPPTFIPIDNSNF